MMSRDDIEKEAERMLEARGQREKELLAEKKQEEDKKKREKKEEQARERKEKKEAVKDTEEYKASLWVAKLKAHVNFVNDDLFPKCDVFENKPLGLAYKQKFTEHKRLLSKLKNLLDKKSKKEPIEEKDYIKACKDVKPAEHRYKNDKKSFLFAVKQASKVIINANAGEDSGAASDDE